MEFTFGLLLGMGLGYAAWLSRNELADESNDNPAPKELKIGTEIILIYIISIVVYFAYPSLIEPLSERMSYESGWISGVFGDVLRIFVNYGFYGFLMVLIIIYRASIAWQIGITLTFCHTAIDLMRDVRPQPDVPVNICIQLFAVSILTLAVAFLVARYRHRKNINNSMLQILVWSTMTIAFVSLGLDLLLEGGLKDSGFSYLIVRVFFVHIVFLASAVYSSRKSFALTN